MRGDGVGARSAGPGPVLVMGEALTDLVPAKNGVLRPRPGGAPANVAAGIARLGGRAVFAGALGDDAFGRANEERLRSAGVDLALCAHPSLPTALAMADPGPHGTRYHFHLRDTATFEVTSRTEGLARYQAVYVGGLAAVVSPAAAAVLATATAAARDSVLAVDPNVRADRTLAPAESRVRLRRLAALADVLKVSDEDARQLWPSSSTETECRARAAEGRLVLLTLGPKGSTAFLPAGGEVSVPAEPLTRPDTIGAGDAFMAAILARLSDTGALTRAGLSALSEADAEDLLRHAASTAAHACGRREF
ncbi:PfkB family carbohydrate kinase [Streptomyces sp. NPDC051020]|uniref:PfkB family carbohydrate kinase n=1 Tax=Streptomyces sp. NPDC051020 TaxID=3155409 RepID=UPI00343168F6